MLASAKPRARAQHDRAGSASAYELAGQPFNLDSPKQIGEILFDKLQLPVVKKTPSGTPSTDEEVLQELAADYPLPKILLEYRGLTKLKSTYTDKLPQHGQPRHRPRAHQLLPGGGGHRAAGIATTPICRTFRCAPPKAAASARPSSRRRAACIVSADYSQIELRIMAHMSGDEDLLRAFAAGEDIHRATAAEVFSREPEAGQQRAAPLRQGHQLRPDLRHVRVRPGAATRHRTRAPPGLHRPLFRALSRREALYGQHAGAGARAGLRGDRVRPPPVAAGNQRAGNGTRRQGAERAAINAPMQGTAADLIKLAMIAVQNWLETRTAARPS